MLSAESRFGAIFAWSEVFFVKAMACERAEWSVRNEATEQAIA